MKNFESSNKYDEATAVRIELHGIPDLFVAFRNLAMLCPNGKTDVVAPISAPMLQIVPIPRKRVFALLHI